MKCKIIGSDWRYTVHFKPNHLLDDYNLRSEKKFTDVAFMFNCYEANDDYVIGDTFIWSVRYSMVIFSWLQVNYC